MLLAEKAAGAPLVLTGSGAALLTPKPADWSVAGGEDIDAKAVARLAAAAPAPTAPPAPLYLRAPDAKPGKPGLFESAAGS